MSALKFSTGEPGVQAAISESGWRGAAIHHEDTKVTKGSLANEQASHSASEKMDVEVDEETDLIAGDFEVGEKLRAVDWNKVFNRLDLDHHGFLDQQV